MYKDNFEIAHRTFLIDVSKGVTALPLPLIFYILITNEAKRRLGITYQILDYKTNIMLK